MTDDLFSHDPEEAALIDAAIRDARAFGPVYERYVQRIYSYLYYRTGNHHDAEDLTARVFFKALQHIGRYQHRGAPFSGWLYRIAHNVVVNWARDNREHNTIALDDVVGYAGSDETPHQQLVRSEEQERLMQAIGALPVDRQQLLVLKFVNRCSNQEIGATLGRTEGAVKSLYHRTLLALKKALEE
jgi:RNA polymerase sigma-70 factor (ECF subfamily)